MYITEIFNKDREALRVLYNLSKAFGYKKFNHKTIHNIWEERLKFASNLINDYIFTKFKDDKNRLFALSKINEQIIDFSSSSIEDLENNVFDSFLEILSKIYGDSIEYHLIYGEDCIVGASTFYVQKYSKKEYIEMLHNRGYSNDDLDSCLIKIGE